MKTGIVFDLDGTLLNTLEDLLDATNYALTACGYPERTLPELRRFVGNGARNQIRLSLPEAGGPAGRRAGGGKGSAGRKDAGADSWEGM